MGRPFHSPERTGRWGRWLGLALTLAVMTPLSWAADSLFAGITQMEAAPGPRTNIQVIRFQADLPFQYQMQVLNEHQVSLRLYNARIASRLADAEGKLPVQSGAVQSARVKPSDNAPYQEVILTGQNLGRQQIVVEGATERIAEPQPQTAKTAKKPIVSLPDLPSPPAANPARIEVDSVPGAIAGAEPAVAPEPAPAKAALTEADRQMPPPAKSAPKEIVMPKAVIQGGPSIEAVMNVPVASARPAGLPTTAMAVPSHPWLKLEPPAETPAAPTDVPMPAEDPSVSPDEPVAEAPDYQMLIPIPRYQGGAAPIQAITLDDNGQPIRLKPKHLSGVMNLDFGTPNGGFNALFHAESGSVPSIGRQVKTALDLYQEGRYPQALNALQQALQQDGQNAELYAALGEVHLKLSKPQEAVKAYRQAARLQPETYEARLTEVLVLAGQRSEAITRLKKRLLENPAQADAAFMLGTLLEEQGDTETALAYLRQAERLKPDSADLQYNLGLAYELNGDRAQAATHYQKAQRLNPGAPDVARALERVSR